MLNKSSEVFSKKTAKKQVLNFTILGCKNVSQSDPFQTTNKNVYKPDPSQE